MAYSGYLIKVGSYTVPFRYIEAKKYKASIKGQDLDSYRDANGILHRDALKNAVIKVEWETPDDIDEPALRQLMDAGRVAIVPKGDWNANVEYKRLDAVAYNNTLYIAKKAVPVGIVPTDTEYWMKCIVGGAGAIATTEDAGVVKAGEDIDVDENGEMSLKTDFDEQTDLSVPTGSETRKTFFGKIVKAITDFIAHKTLKATASVLGHVKISNSAAITTEGEYALDAVEKNASIDGTMAHDIAANAAAIEDVNDNLIDFMISKYVGTTYSISGNGAATLQFLLPIVDGYTPVFYIVRGSGNSNVFPSAFGGYINAGNTSVSTIVKNTGTALSDITASIAVMYIKTVFVTQFFVP